MLEAETSPTKSAGGRGGGGGRLPADEDYQRQKMKMESNIKHHSSCVPSQKRKKSKSPLKKDVKVSFDGANEKLLVLKDENMHLKSRGQQLEEEVKMIATKLKRQMTQLKRDKLVGSGGAPSSYAKIDEELDRIIEENFSLQDEERKLMSAVKKLQKKKQESIASTSAKVKKLSKGKRESSRSQSPSKVNTLGLTRGDNSAQEFLFDAHILKQHLDDTTRKMSELRAEVDMTMKANHGQVPSEDLIMSLRQKELQVQQQKVRLEDLQQNLHLKDLSFQEQQAYLNGLVEELKALNTEYLRLQKDARTFEEANKDSAYLQQKITDAKLERDRLQKEFDTIARQPFFRKETDQTQFKRISELQAKIEDRDRGIREAKESIIKIDDQIRTLTDEQRKLKMERDAFSEDIDRLRNQVDPTSMSFSDIQRRIHDLDPSLFRQVMKDLKYDGEEPIWAKFDFMERLKLGPNNEPYDENDPNSLRKEIERLQKEKMLLASELEKVQNLLKMQVNIDKETAHIYQQEVDNIKAQIANDNRKIHDLNALITQRNQRLIAITKQTASLAGTQALTAEGLSRIDKELNNIQRAQRDEDLLSEFSAVTNESEVAPMENVMDLLVSRAQFDQQKLSQILGNKEILPSAVQTFVTIDFFNHETRHSGLSEGFEPNYSTQFSFKNAIDDFYIQHLEKNTMVLEFFITRAQNAVKIGTARVVLSKLLEKDHTFQAQEIVYDGGLSGNSDVSGFQIGKIFFKMRMRKPIDEALRMYQQKRAMRLSRDPASMALSQPGVPKTRSKVVTIQIQRCLDLKRPEQPNIHAIKTSEMQPFFYFQFYTFEGYYSPVMTGSSPHFDLRKQYEVELTEQFLEYMKSQVLQIDLIDESIDITRVGGEAKDFIGRVRIPLKDLLIGGGTHNEEINDTFPVRDEMGQPAGYMEVKLTYKDMLFTEDQQQRMGDTFVISKFAEREIITKIASKFADSLIESIDMIFDMLIEPNSLDTQRISKYRFKDYVLSITNNIREQDIDILLKTNSLIAGKDWIELNDFRNMFEVPVQQAKQKKIEEVAEREKNYMHAQRMMKQQTLNNNTFGPGQLPTGAPLDATLNQRNQVLDQSLNQRAMLDTPGFQNLQKSSTVGGRAPLKEFLRDKVYLVINKFREATRGQAFANFDQFRYVMVDVTSSMDADIEREIAAFWSEYNINDQFWYQEQLLKIYGQAINKTQIHQDTALYQQFIKRSQDPQVIRIKEKIQNYLIKYDQSLEYLFGFIDKNKSQSVTIEELTKGLQEVLTDAEAVTLFQSIDYDQNNLLTYEELVNGCSKIYASYVLHKLRQAIQGGASKGLSIDSIFTTVDDNNNGEMDITEFYEVVKLCYNELKAHEVDTLFAHFDKRGLGKITKDEFQRGLNEPLSLENSLKFSLHDFMTSLQTHLKYKQIPFKTVFEIRAGKEKTTIGIEDFKQIIRDYLKIELSEVELLHLETTIKSFYDKRVVQSGQIALDQATFVDFMSRDFRIKNMDPGNSVIAKQTLARVRLSLKAQGGQKSLESIMQPYLDDALIPGQHQKVINIRSMKVFLMVVGARGLSASEVENLVEFLDQDRNGFIGLQDFDKELSFSA